MGAIPLRFIVSKSPQQYLPQGLGHCSVYCVKAILSAYGLDNKKHPKEYHTNWLSQITGITFGGQYVIKILKSYGIPAEMDTAKNCSDSDKIKQLEKIISNNTPAMLRIGNGYVTNKYNPIIGKLIMHWITLWGYDRRKKIFYVYDSGLPKKYWNKNLPIGNTLRTYKEILRDWNFGRRQLWCWYCGREDFVYVRIEG